MKMIKRTIKPAAGESSVSAAAAKSAARLVYRDRTGKFVVSKYEISGRTVRERTSGVARIARTTRPATASRGATASKKR
jgi:hypothetical protein